jgi:hypothetical protein
MAASARPGVKHAPDELGAAWGWIVSALGRRIEEIGDQSRTPESPEIAATRGESRATINSAVRLLPQLMHGPWWGVRSRPNGHRRSLA